MLRFAILRHDMPPRDGRGLHYDLLLEEEQVAKGAARTFALDELPGKGRTVSAIALAPHRKHYFDYEGPVSGDRGTVSRIDRGTCEWITDGDDLVILRIVGEVFRGELRIARDSSVNARYQVNFEPTAIC